jgi:hypothetical protein
MNTEKIKLLALPLAIVVGAAMFSWAHYETRVNTDTLTVTGSAKRAAKADTVKWTGSWSRTVYVDGIRDGFSQVSHDKDVVVKYLKDAGVTDDQILVGAVTTEQIFNYNNPGAPAQYTLRQSMTVSSSDLEKVTGLAKGIQVLADRGVIFSAGQPEYYISNLPQLRVELLGEAVKDAMNRAQSIASAGGVKVGRLQSASVGVVQVLSPNSTDVADFGQYDTSTVDKEVMVTARTIFNVK